MEKELFEQKKKLKREIQIAERLLQQNFDEASFTDYLSIGTSVIPALVNGVLKNPIQTISKVDALSTNLLPKSKKMGPLYKVFSLLLDAFNLWRKK